MTTLADVCSHIVDCKNRTAPVDMDGEFFAIGTPAMRGNIINFAEARRINARTFDEWTARLMPESGDLLLAREAPVGPVVIVPKGENVAAGQRTTLLRVDPKKANAVYLRHYLIAAPTQARLLAHAHGSTTPHLRVDDIRRFVVDIPPLEKQQEIAEVLGAFDDKIAANTALAVSADTLLREEFRAFLLKTEVMDKPVSDVATVVLGGTPSRARAEYWTDGTVPWLNSGELNATRILRPSELITEEALLKSAAKMMPAGATLIAITGATLGQMARLEISASGNQSIVGVWAADPDTTAWLYFALQERRALLLSRATGAAQQHVSKGDVEQLKIPVPSREVLRMFGEFATPILDLAANIERESITLATVRDTLLPQLVSDKLRIRDIDLPD